MSETKGLTFVLIVKEDIISRINNGDAKAFEQLYTTFYVYLCAVATKYVYNPEAAREIVNDVFMNVWNHVRYRDWLLYQF